MSTHTVNVTLRVPEGLYADLKLSASADRRSLNAQGIVLWEEALKQREAKKARPAR
jgi:hypothetical protein